MRDANTNCILLNNSSGKLGPRSESPLSVSVSLGLSRERVLVRRVGDGVSPALALKSGAAPFGDARYDARAAPGVRAGAERRVSRVGGNAHALVLAHPAKGARVAGPPTTALGGNGPCASGGLADSAGAASRRNNGREGAPAVPGVLRCARGGVLGLRSNLTAPRDSHGTGVRGAQGRGRDKLIDAEH